MWQSRAALYILQPVNYLRSPLPISVLVRIWILSSSLAGDENQPNSYILKKSKIMQLLERNVLPVQTLCCWTFPNSSLILMHSPHFGVYFLHCVLQEFCYIETLALLEACANWSWVKNLFFVGSRPLLQVHLDPLWLAESRGAVMCLWEDLRGWSEGRQSLLE